MLSVFWAVRLVMIVFPAENHLKSFKILENDTFLEFRQSETIYYIYSTDILTRDAFPTAKTRKEGFRKVFNVWTKSHFSNFEVG